RLHFEVVNPPGDLFGTNALQQGDGVVVDHPPDARIELTKKVADLRLPGPPQVLGELTQLLIRAVGKFVHRDSVREREAARMEGANIARSSGGRYGKGGSGERRSGLECSKTDATRSIRSRVASLRPAASRSMRRDASASRAMERARKVSSISLTSR